MPELTVSDIAIGYRVTAYGDWDDEESVLNDNDESIGFLRMTFSDADFLGYPDEEMDRVARNFLNEMYSQLRDTLVRIRNEIKEKQRYQMPDRAEWEV